MEFKLRIRENSSCWEKILFAENKLVFITSYYIVSNNKLLAEFLLHAMTFTCNEVGFIAFFDYRNLDLYLRNSPNWW